MSLPLSWPRRKHPGGALRPGQRTKTNKGRVVAAGDHEVCPRGAPHSNGGTKPVCSLLLLFGGADGREALSATTHRARRARPGRGRLKQ